MAGKGREPSAPENDPAQQPPRVPWLLYGMASLCTVMHIAGLVLLVMVFTNQASSNKSFATLNKRVDALAKETIQQLEDDNMSLRLQVDALTQQVSDLGFLSGSSFVPAETAVASGVEAKPDAQASTLSPKDVPTAEARKVLEAVKALNDADAQRNAQADPKAKTYTPGSIHDPATLY